MDQQQLEARRKFGIPNPEAPLCVSYGAGVDSTAMLVAMWNHGVRPDLITFADTGDEHPDTYAYLPVIQAWLRACDFPPLAVVRYSDYAKHTRYRTLYENCIANKTLPSIAFGGKACSLKFKAAPQNRYREEQPIIREARRRGIAVTVCIGYDAGAKDSKRGAVLPDKRYTYVYPLRLLGLDRDACAALILRAGLPLPRKSACTFCSQMTVQEVADLVDHHPQCADKSVHMEANAAPNLTAIEGLWRNGCKGTRGSTKRPGSMAVFIRERRALKVVA